VSSDFVTVTTRLGALRGRMVNGVASFKGVPYAAPPFGAHRLRPPQAPASWEGVRDALEFGATAPKPPYTPPFDALLAEPVIPGDDCLNLNVWTPEPAGSGLPVLVWVHGGAFVNGSGAVPTYDGSHFARDGVVCVTINYRLGAEGFLLLEGGSANLGLLDQVAALRWVRDNIAAFGGDASRVTIAGESAGAMGVTSLLSMPSADGLFRRVIAQSGAGHHALSAATARRVAGFLTEKLGVPATREGLAAVPVEQVLEAQVALSAETVTAPDPARWGEVMLNLMPYEPAVDGEVLPALPIERVAAGAGAGVDLLVGTNSEEHRFFLVPSGVIDLVNDGMLGLTAAGYRLPASAIEVYRRNRPGATPGDVMAAIMTDWFFRIPAIRLAEAHAAGSGSNHVYEFAWRSPVMDGRLGCGHASELAFTFDNLDREGNLPLLGPNPPQTLADEMHRAWVSFVASGDPGWPRYDASRRVVKRFDVTSEVVEDPAADERRLWDGIR
jgi:para-nitrobenzyl esterase